MKFWIDEGAYARGAVAEGVAPLRALASERMLFIKESALPLLEAAGSWTDFDEFCANLAEEKRADCRDALTALECFGLARVEGRERAGDKDCRLAGERDYAAVAAFMLKNAADPRGFASVVTADYFNEISVRERQFNNREYNFCKWREGALVAVLVVAVPDPEQVLCVATVQAAVFAGEMGEAERRACLGELFAFAVATFAGEFAKFRFPYTDARQDWLLAALKELGFAQICTLRAEIYNQIDLTLYDRFVD